MVKVWRAKQQNGDGLIIHFSFLPRNMLTLLALIIGRNFVPRNNLPQTTATDACLELTYQQTYLASRRGKNRRRLCRSFWWTPESKPLIQCNVQNQFHTPSPLYCFAVVMAKTCSTYLYRLYFTDKNSSVRRSHMDHKYSSSERTKIVWANLLIFFGMNRDYCDRISKSSTSDKEDHREKAKVVRTC